MYKIIKLTVENFKKLKAIALDFDENRHLVMITGKNEQGKSAVLDSIEWAFAGKTALKDTPMRIRRGEEKAVVKVDLGELAIIRTETHKSETLKVVNEKGFEYSQPQTMLESLYQPIAFDPLDFLKLKPKEQYDILLSLLELPEDPKKIDEERKQIYDKRTELNREFKFLDNQLKALPVPTGDIPDEPIDNSSIQNKIAEIDKIKTNRIELKNCIDIDMGELNDLECNIDEMERELENNKNRVIELKALISVKEAAYNNFKFPDASIIQAEIDRINELNKQVDNKQKYTKLSTEVGNKDIEIDMLTKQIEAFDTKKVDMLSQAKFPIKGLSVADERILYKDIPLSQCSSTERLFVSTAIPMAINPNLRIILLREASMLDSDHLKFMEKLAEKRDFVILAEIVDESGKGEKGIVIEDGGIKINNYEKVKEEIEAKDFDL